MKDTSFLSLILFFSCLIGPMMYSVDLFKVLGNLTLKNDKLVSFALSLSSIFAMASKLLAPLIWNKLKYYKSLLMLCILVNLNYVLYIIYGYEKLAIFIFVCVDWIAVNLLYIFSYIIKF